MESSLCPCPSGAAANTSIAECSSYSNQSLSDLNLSDYCYDIVALEEEPVGETWEMIYVGVVLLVMFAALLSDRIGVSAPVLNHTFLYVSTERPNHSKVS